MKKLTFLIVLVAAISFIGCDNNSSDDEDTFYTEVGIISKERYDLYLERREAGTLSGASQIAVFFREDPNTTTTVKYGVKKAALERDLKDRYGNVTNFSVDTFMEGLITTGGYIQMFSFTLSTNYEYYYAVVE